MNCRLLVIPLLSVLTSLAKADVTGTVTSQTLGTGVAGIDVIAVDSADTMVEVARDTTDSMGNYTLSLSGTPANVKIFTQSNGQMRGLIDQVFNSFGNFQCNMLNCSNSIGGGTDVPFNRGTPLDFDLLDGVYAFGTVTDDMSGSPIAGVDVCVFDTITTPPYFAERCSTTDGAGQYRTIPGSTFSTYSVATNMVPGDYVREVFLQGAGDLYFLLNDANVSDLVAGTVVSGDNGMQADFALIEGSTISGDVRDADTSTPLASPNVTILSTDGLIDLNLDLFGAPGYASPNLPPGDYVVHGTTNDGGYANEVFDGGPGIFCDDGDFNTPSTCDPIAEAQGAPVNIAAGVPQIVNLDLNQLVALDGSVTDSGGPAVPNVDVCVYLADGFNTFTGRCGTTGGAGYDSLFVPMDTDIRLVADPAGAPAAFQTQIYRAVPNGMQDGLPIDFSQGDILNLSAGASNLDFDLATATGRFFGQVFDVGMPDTLIQTFDFRGVVSVKVYDMDGNFLAKSAFVDDIPGPGTDGYQTPGLDAGNYRLVFDSLDEPAFGSLSLRIDEVQTSGGGVQCIDMPCDPMQGDPINLAGDTQIDETLDTGGYVSGFVTDAPTGTPIGNATVHALVDGSSPPVRSAVVFPDGFYEMWLTDAGNFKLASDTVSLNVQNEFYDNFQCTDPGGVCLMSQATDFENGMVIVPNTNTPTENINFDLDPILYTFSGNVTDGDPPNGPLENVMVTVTDSGMAKHGQAKPAPAFTDASGNYTIDLRAGTYDLQFDLANYDMVIVSSVDLGAGFPDPQVNNVMLPRTQYSISGTITDSADASPIDMADVCLFDDTGVTELGCTMTNSLGDYTLMTGFGSYQIEARSTEFTTARYLAGDTVTVNAGTPSVNGVDLALDPVLYPITVTVAEGMILSMGGAAITDATVTLELDGTMTQVDQLTMGAGGTYNFNIRAGLYQVTADGTPDFGTASMGGLRVDAGNPMNRADLALIRSTGSITGTIVDQGDGTTPLINVTVQAFDMGGMFVASDVTDAAGAYSIGLDVGNYLLLADGTLAGLISEIYNGSGMPGIACAIETCAADVLNGVAVAVMDMQATIADFSLSPGTLLAGSTATGDGLGTSVTVCDPHIAIGAPGDDEAGVDAGAVFIYRKQGQGYVFVTKVLPEPADMSDPSGTRFGSSVACADGTFVFGAPGDDAGGAKGMMNPPDKSAYIFALTGGGTPSLGMIQQVVQQNLGGGMLTGDTGFGSAVAINGGTVAIGAPTAGSGMAAVLQFDSEQSSPWALATMLSDPAANPGAGFGTALAVSNGMVAIGAPGQTNDTNGLTSGVAQIFQNITGGSNWDTIGKFSNAGNADDGFGLAISIEGGMVAVGAPGDDTATQDGGAAYLFANQGGNFVQMGGAITPGDQQAGDQFGASISLGNGSLAVGAPNADGASPNAGAGYLFDGDNGFALLQRIAAATGNTGDGFGSAIAFDGSGLVIGAPNALVGANRAGLAQAQAADALFGSSFEGQ